jgi:CubicO group peptidase (beta-lactamase class C family)
MRISFLLALIAPLASSSCSQASPCPHPAPAQPAPAAVAAPDHASLDALIRSAMSDWSVPSLALAWTVLDRFLDVDPHDWSAAYLNAD